MTWEVNPNLGRKWGKYWRDCALANRQPQMKPKWIPRPLPGNEAAYAAFKIVKHARHVSFAGMIGFNWVDVATKLTPHGLWTADVERKLSQMETAMLNLEETLRQEEAEMKGNADKKGRR